MITIIHGDDTKKSRNFLFDIKAKNNPTQTFYKDSYDIQTVIQIVEGSGLFEPTQTIIFEEFLGGKKSEIGNIIDYIIKNSRTHNFYFWEPKQLTPSQVSILKQAKVELFKLPQTLFSFLDSLKPSSPKIVIKGFHSALDTVDADFLFYMIIRQFRLLIAVSDTSTAKSIDETARLAPWQLTKLKKQGELFGYDRLIDLYKKLNSIEYKQKMGQLVGGLERNIDFFLLSF